MPAWGVFLIPRKVVECNWSLTKMVTHFGPSWDCNCVIVRLSQDCERSSSSRKESLSSVVLVWVFVLVSHNIHCRQHITVQQDPKWLPTLGSGSDHKYELFVLITYPKTGYQPYNWRLITFLNNIIIHLDYAGIDYSWIPWGILYYQKFSTLSTWGFLGAIAYVILIVLGTQTQTYNFSVQYC